MRDGRVGSCYCYFSVNYLLCKLINKTTNYNLHDLLNSILLSYV